MQNTETETMQFQCNPLTPEQIMLLNALADHDMAGEALREVVGLCTSIFNDAASGLWALKLFRGISSDGCCNDPCGSACMSANKLERVWGLTSFGNIAFQFYLSNKETNI